MSVEWSADLPPRDWYLAAELGDVDVLKAVLEPHPSLVDARGRNAYTFLICAAWGGRTELIDYLLRKGADPNLKNFKGETALYWCAVHANVESVRLLLSHGAEPAAVDDEGSTVLMAAFKNGAGSPGVVRQLLACPTVDVDATDQNGDTAVVMAARAGDAESIRIMVEMGHADFTAGNPLEIATLKGKEECVHVLQEAERAYMLYKARTAYDIHTKHERFPFSPLPGYLTARTAASEELPQLEIVETRGSQDVVACVLREVLMEANEGVFTELRHVLGRTVGHSVKQSAKPGGRPLVLLADPGGSNLAFTTMPFENLLHNFPHLFQNLPAAFFGGHHGYNEEEEED